MLNQEDHDLLIEIRADLKNHMKRMEKHFDEDDSNFKGLHDDIDGIQKWRWQLAGAMVLGFGLFEFVARVWAR